MLQCGISLGKETRSEGKSLLELVTERLFVEEDIWILELLVEAILCTRTGLSSEPFSNVLDTDHSALHW